MGAGVVYLPFVLFAECTQCFTSSCSYRAATGRLLKSGSIAWVQGLPRTEAALLKSQSPSQAREEMGRNTRAEASHLSTSAARHSSSAGPQGYPASLLAPMAFHAGSNLCSGNARATACPNPSRPSPPDLYLQPKSQCPEPLHKATSLGTGCSHHHAAEVSR